MRIEWMDEVEILRMKINLPNHNVLGRVELLEQAPHAQYAAMMNADIVISPAHRPMSFATIILSDSKNFSAPWFGI